MANAEHLARLREGVESWNSWRAANPSVGRPDFRNADLRETSLSGANFNGADLQEAKLQGTNLSSASLRNVFMTRAKISDSNLERVDLLNAFLRGAEFQRTNLQHAHLPYADVEMADLSDADLSYANLDNANLYLANLSGANLTGASLLLAKLVGTNFERANLSSCNVYGASVWDVKLDGAIQSNLVVSPHNQGGALEVDHLEVAQFIYLLLHNEKIRDVIDTIGKKAVLILGRFTPERKAILNAIREELRRHGYLPILFDFEKPAMRDLQETVTTLAGMSRFVIADITDAKSVIGELNTIVPNFPSVPVQPLLESGSDSWAMFDHMRNFRSVLEAVSYEKQGALLACLSQEVIARAEQKAVELARK